MDNQDRSRWSGIRVGDLVEESAFGKTTQGRVVALHPLDNNAVYACKEGEPESRRFKLVAEWCEVVKKVQD